jgi:DNA topoisomerase VI subunit B
MLKDTKAITLAAFLCDSFSRVSPAVARKICEAAKLSTRARAKNIGRTEADSLYKAIQETKIPAPATDCIAPIGEELIIKGLHQIVPGEFYTAATRPPSVYRGNPFLIEVGLAYGGAPVSHKVSREALAELLEESDARTLRQFLITTFSGLGADGADRILANSGLKTRVSPSNLKPAEMAKLHEALQTINVSEGQSMNILRYANRVPLQFQAGGCAITQTVMQTNWRSYGLSQSRGSLPADIVRATLDGIAFRVYEVVKAMSQDASQMPPHLKVVGGPSGNPYLMQYIADLLNIQVRVAAAREATAMGIANLAAHSALGISLAELASCWQAEAVYSPQIGEEERTRRLAKWNKALEAVKYYHREPAL